MEGLSGTGDKMPLDLFAKMGPLPVWAWGALAVGGYLYWSHTHAASATPTTDTPVDATAYDPNATDGTYANVDPSSAGYDYGSVNSGGYTGTVTGTAYASNQAWAVAAIQQLISAGVPASTATSAVTHYLSGMQLTPDEGNAVNEGIALLGPPPLPLPVNIGSGTPVVPVQSTADTMPTNEPAPTPVVTTTPTSIMQGTLSGYQYDAQGNQISGPYQGVPGANGLGFLGSTTSIAPGEPGYVNPSTPQTQAPGWYDTDAQGHFLSGDYAAYQKWAAANPQFVH